MSETPATTSQLEREPLLGGHWTSAEPHALISGSAMQHKAVRFGSLESARVTLAKHLILPCAVVMVLGICALAFGQPLSAEYRALGLVSFLIAAQIFSPLDLRSGSGIHSAGKFVLRRLIEWACIIAVLMFLAVSFNLTHIFARDLLLWWFCATPFALSFANSACRAIARWRAADQPAAQRHIIIGANEIGLELARRVEQSGAGGFCGFFDYRSADRLTEAANRRLTGNCKAGDFADVVRRHAIDRVYIALPIETTPRITQLLEELRDTTASVYFVPNIFAFDLVQPRCVEINGMPAFSICDSPLQGMSGFWKRTLDVTLAVLLLLLIWPALSAIALAIKYSSPGPVLFKQRRYGLNGEEILVYKFRSMTVCEDGPIIAQATPQDRRVTRLGAILRRTSLDELPQILNVIEGKMSFVGPRPHAVAHNEEYRKLINGYMIRHKVRPGITGWAQVNGLRGETSVERMRQRVQYDLDYLRNWSLWLDLKIIAKTGLTVLRDGNAY